MSEDHNVWLHWFTFSTNVGSRGGHVLHFLVGGIQIVVVHDHNSIFVRDFFTPALCEDIDFEFILWLFWLVWNHVEFYKCFFVFVYLKTMADQKQV